MELSSLSPHLLNLLTPSEPIKFDSNRVTGDAKTEGSFADILTEALSTASEADMTDKLSSIELLTGMNDDLSGMMLDLQKAELSLNLALQIRNKIVDAYTEIMRMQV